MEVNKTFVSSADHSGKDGYAMKYSGGVLAVCSAITDRPIGICTKGGTVAEAVTEVCMFGECSAIAGGTITAGQFVGSHTDSTLVASAESSNAEIGIALESAVAGDWFNVFVIPNVNKF